MPKRRKGGLEKTTEPIAVGRKFILALTNAENIQQTFCHAFTDLISKTNASTTKQTKELAIELLALLRAELIRFKPQAHPHGQLLVDMRDFIIKYWNIQIK